MYLTDKYDDDVDDDDDNDDDDDDYDDDYDFIQKNMPYFVGDTLEMNTDEPSGRHLELLAEFEKRKRVRNFEPVGVCQI